MQAELKKDQRENKMKEKKAKKSEAKESKMRKAILFYILVVSIISLFIAVYIELNKTYRFDPCFQEMVGCAIVTASSFSQIVGIPLSIIGIIAYIILIFLCLIHIKKNDETSKKVLFVFLLAMFLFSLYLIYAQVFVIHSICKYCLVVDLLTISMFFTYLSIFLR